MANSIPGKQSGAAQGILRAGFRKLSSLPIQKTWEVEPRGFEPLTSAMPLRRSTN